jgi:hypothetical protein
MERRSCENCGNVRCANSLLAFWWDECVESNFEKHWIPKIEQEATNAQTRSRDNARRI